MIGIPHADRPKRKIANKKTNAAANDETKMSNAPYCDRNVKFVKKKKSKLSNISWSALRVQIAPIIIPAKRKIEKNNTHPFLLKSNFNRNLLNGRVNITLFIESPL